MYSNQIKFTFSGRVRHYEKGELIVESTRTEKSGLNK